MITNGAVDRDCARDRVHSDAPSRSYWAVNTRSTILLAQAFAAQHDGRPGGRIIFMTSGQDLGPMRDEVAYAASKDALASIIRTLADHPADQAIILNTINPGRAADQVRRLR